MIRCLCLALGLFLIAFPLAAQEPGVAQSTVKDGTVTVDTWNARYCEFLLIKGSAIRLEADVYNTLGLNTCDPAAFAAIDAEALKKQFGVRGVFKNGPRFWVVSTLSSHEKIPPAPVENFGGIEARLVGVVQLPPGMHKGTSPYKETTVQRDTKYGYPKGRPIFVLDDPQGMPWVMQAYSQIVDPGLTLEALGDFGGRLDPPEGWSYRTMVLEKDLVVHPVDGTARIVQDGLANTYDACFDTACDWQP